MNIPCVSVIIPTYNRKEKIFFAIDSVLEQTYRNIEVVVVDDGSTDNTNYYLKKKYGNKISLIIQKNSGPSAARNAGVMNSNGEYLAFLDSDDTWALNKIELQMELMLANLPYISCCITNAHINKTGSIETSFRIAPLECEGDFCILTNPIDILITRFILFNQVALLPRKNFFIAGGYNEKLKILEDYDLALRLAKMGPWGIINMPLVNYNKNSDDNLSIFTNEKEIEFIKSLIYITNNLKNNDSNRKAKYFIYSNLLTFYAKYNYLLFKNTKYYHQITKFIFVTAEAKHKLERKMPWYPKPNVYPANKNKMQVFK